MNIYFFSKIKYVFQHANEEIKEADIKYPASFLWEINHKYCTLQC